MFKFHAFLQACCDGDLATVKRMYEQYPQQLNPNQRFGEYGMNALMQASFYGQAHVVQFLVDAANGSLHIHGTWTPGSLIEAAGEGWIATVEYLLHQGVDPNYTDEDGETAMINACRNGRIDVVKCLIEHGADCEHHDDGGLATLVYSDKGGYLDLAVYFIEIVGVNVNAADEDDDNIVNLCSNHTPFDHNVPVFRYFLSQGFNIHYISKNKSRSVLMCLCDCFQWRKSIQYVINYGCNIDHQSQDGTTALMNIILSESEENARWLISEGHCNINLQDELGETALMKLVRRGPLSLVRYFIEVGKADVAIRNKICRFFVTHIKRLFMGLCCKDGNTALDMPHVPASIARYLQHL